VTVYQCCDLDPNLIVTTHPLNCSPSTKCCKRVSLHQLRSHVMHPLSRTTLQSRSQTLRRRHPTFPTLRNLSCSMMRLMHCHLICPVSRCLHSLVVKLPQPFLKRARSLRVFGDPVGDEHNQGTRIKQPKLTFACAPRLKARFR
jgi:hypothetical protein